MRHPVHIAAMLVATIALLFILIKWPVVIAPLIACLVLAASMTACACAFSTRRRNDDDPDE